MSNFSFNGCAPHLIGIVKDMSYVQKKHCLFGMASGRFANPTDPIGNFSLTLTNVVVGSAIQIESQDGLSTLYNGVAATASPVIGLQAYASGAPLNDLRIKVRKGSASPYYQPFETLATAFVGSQSIYVAQIPEE